MVKAIQEYRLEPARYSFDVCRNWYRGISSFAGNQIIERVILQQIERVYGNSHGWLHNFFVEREHSRLSVPIIRSMKSTTPTSDFLARSRPRAIA